MTTQEARGGGKHPVAWNGVHCDLRWVRALLRGRKGRLLAIAMTLLMLHLDILPAVASTHFKPAAARVKAPSLPPVPLKVRLKTWLAAVLPWQRMQEIPPLAPAPGLPPAWGASASVYGGVVNLGNGNLTLQVPLVGWANGVSFVLFFNSQANAADPSPVAPKWTHNWYVTLTLNPNQTQATLREGDGSRWIYTDTDRDGVFTSPAGVFDRLVRRSDGRYVLTRKGSEEHWVFSLRQQEQGVDVRRLEQVIDRYGNAIQLLYMGEQLTTIQDRYDRTLTLLYSNNRLWKVRDFIGREWELVYTPTGRLWKVRYPVVLDTSREPFEERVYEIGFGYNSRGNVISWTDRLGNTWQYEYLSATSDVLKRFTDPAGHKWTASYFLPGATPVGGDVPEAGSSRWTDPTGRWVEYGFDKTATVARITQGSDTTTLRLTTRFWYNEQNLLIKKQDPAGLVWEWSYDSQGNLLWSKEPNGARTEYSYYPGTDHVWKIKDALGNEWEYTYTRYGDVDSVVDPEKAETSFEYDYELGEPAYGHLRQVIDPMKRMTEYVYYAADDAKLARRGLLKRVIVPGGFWRELDYGGAGWLTRREVQTANGSEVTTYTYDNWGRLRLIDYPRSADVSMGWDGESRRVRVQDGFGRREYTYDAWGRITRQQGCCGNEEGIEVVAVTAEYDPAGRKRYERELNSSGVAIRTIVTTYDALGRLQTIGDYRGQVVYSYEETTGRLRRESYPNGSYVEYAYYGTDNPSQVGFVWKVEYKKPDGSLLIGYEYTYDLLGRVVQSVERPSGDTTVYTYTPAGRLGSENRTGQVWYQRHYVYNRDGSRQRVYRHDVLNGEHNEEYVYDLASGRLIAVRDTIPEPDVVHSFHWNPEGTLRLRWGSNCSTYADDTVCQRYSYDEEGRVLTVERWYSDRGAGWYLVEQYQYNGDGVRIWSNEYGVEYRYLCGIGCHVRANRVYSRNGIRWELYEERLSTPTVFFYGAPAQGDGWWLNAVHSLLAGYILSAFTPPHEWILVPTDRFRMQVYPYIQLAKVKRLPKHWGESWILICTRPLIGMPKVVDCLLGPEFRHWLIAACGQIFEVPPGSTPKLDPDHPKAPGDHQLPDCAIIPVSPFEKRCICSYAKYLQEKWKYDLFSSNCQDFVMEVLQACMLNPPVAAEFLYIH